MSLIGIQRRGYSIAVVELENLGMSRLDLVATLATCIGLVLVPVLAIAIVSTPSI